MKKTILMMVFAIVAMVAMPSKVMAANVAGDYVGKLTRVYMNKEKTPTDDEVITTVNGLTRTCRLAICQVLSQLMLQTFLWKMVLSMLLVQSN